MCDSGSVTNLDRSLMKVVQRLPKGLVKWGFVTLFTPSLFRILAGTPTMYFEVDIPANKARISDELCIVV